MPVRPRSDDVKGAVAEAPRRPALPPAAGGPGFASAANPPGPELENGAAADEDHLQAPLEEHRAGAAAQLGRVRFILSFRFHWRAPGSPRIMQGRG